MAESTLDLDAVVALADLVARTGASQLDVGYQDDTDDYREARWYAQAYFRGARVIVDEQPNPSIAADKLAARLLNGGRCSNCNRTATTDTDADYRRFCRWYRDGDAWVQSCNGKRRATKDVPA